MTNPIAVSQRAREAAGTAWVDWRGKSHVEDEIMAIIEGKNDCHPLAQAFARFEAEIRADEREQIQNWLKGCSGSFRATTVADAIAALEHKDAIRNQKDHDHE